MAKILFLTMGINILSWTISAQDWSPKMYDAEYFKELGFDNHGSQEHGFERFIHSKIGYQYIDQRAIKYPLLQAAIFYMTNRERHKKGLPPLKYKPELEQAARDHSKDMVKYNFFDHTSPVRGKRTPDDRLKKVGIKGTVGENIIEQNLLQIESNQTYYTPSQNGGYFSFEYRGEPIANHTYLGLAQKCLERWMKSPSHRKNILNPDYEYLGCGAALDVPKNKDQPNRFMVTQNFAGN